MAKRVGRFENLEEFLNMQKLYKIKYTLWDTRRLERYALVLILQMLYSGKVEPDPAITALISTLENRAGD